MLDLTVIAVSLSLVFVFWVFLFLLLLVGWLLFGWLIELFTSLGDLYLKGNYQIVKVCYLMLATLREDR